MLGAMACVAPARPAMRSTATFCSRDLYNFMFSTEIIKADRGDNVRHHHHHHQITEFSIRHGRRIPLNYPVL
jgi:hypothetical protein